VNEQTASDWLVGELKSHSVEWIATLCGHGLDPLFHSARKAGIRLIDVRNEQTAGYIAEAYGRLTRRPGVCASSSGVAAANAMTGVMNAWFDHAPMLYISGSANLTTLGIGCFQDCDQVALLKPVTKFSRLIDVPHRTVQRGRPFGDDAAVPRDFARVFIWRAGG
jgi:acetolactate synthase-1/2/3 large subunit